MPSSRLLMYPFTSLTACALIYILWKVLSGRFKSLDDQRGIRRNYVGIAALCIAGIILYSTCVTLTAGKVHLFMFAEPALLLAAIVFAVRGEVKMRKSNF